MDVLFIHGNSFDQTTFKYQLEDPKLAARFNLYAMDLPCHGVNSHSPIPRSVDELAESILEFSLKLNCENLTLVGHSLGGHIAIQSLPKFKNTNIHINGIFVFGTPPLRSPIPDNAFHADGVVPFLTETLSGEDIEKMAQHIHPKFSASIRNTNPKIRTFLANVVACGEIHDEVKILNEYKGIPAVIHGRMDHLINLDYILSLPLNNLWRGGLQIIESAGHYPQWTHFDVFNKMLLQYLEEIFKPGSSN